MPSPPRMTRRETQRLERHAASQAKSNDARIARCAPRREDMARAAYYALLMYCEEAGTEADRAAFRNPFLNILAEAGFDRAACVSAFEGHAGTILPDLDDWLARRWETEGERLQDGRDRYVPLADRGQKEDPPVLSRALTAFLPPVPQASAAETE